MTTLFIEHADFLMHETPPGHPERVDRLQAVQTALEAPCFAELVRQQAPLGTATQILSAHTQEHLGFIQNSCPARDFAHIDADTFMSPGSWQAALRAVGGACLAVDEVMAGKARNAFVACRPPGHHAEAARAMGFCLFNAIAIAARHAQAAHGAARVAIVDFDVHHGNGTQDIFWADPTVLYCSSHQMPLYPGTGAAEERGTADTIVNVPLPPGADGLRFRAAMEEIILPRVAAFDADVILISAGFDAHRRDPLGGLNLDEDDFVWITRELMQIADDGMAGRLVSVLEGGYDLKALAASTAAHVAALMRRDAPI